MSAPCASSMLPPQGRDFSLLCSLTKVQHPEYWPVHNRWSYENISYIKFYKISPFRTSCKGHLPLEKVRVINLVYFLLSPLRRGSPGRLQLNKGKWFHPWVGNIPWRREWQRTPVFLPGESQGQRSLIHYSPWGHEELDTAEATWHSAIQKFHGTDVAIRSPSVYYPLKTFMFS